MRSNNNYRNVSILFLFLLLILGSTISFISNTSKIYSIIIEDLKKKVFKEETVLPYIYSISIIGFCIIPSGIIFSKRNSSRNVLLYGITVTLAGYIFLYITQKISIYYMKKNLVNDLSNSIFFILSYGISFALILQGGVTLNLGSLWINLLYWPIKYGGLITSIQFTLYSIGGLTLSEIYRLFFLDSGSILNFFLTCFCISAIIGFFSIYIIIIIEKKITSSINNDTFDYNIENSSITIKFDDNYSDTINNEYNNNELKETINNKIMKYNRTCVIGFIKRSNDESKKCENILMIDNNNNNYNIENFKDNITICEQFSDDNKEDITNINKKKINIKEFKKSIYNFKRLISNIEIVSLIFVYLFTISTGQFFGTFIQRFSIYYIPNITKEKSIRMIQILTVIELFVRVLSGYISDLLDNGKILHKSTQTIILTLIMSLSLLLINYLKSNWVLVIFGVGFSYAAMYSIAPSYIRSLYKQNEFALVNSFCYSMVIPGNLILSIVLANTPQKYTTSLQIIGYLSLIPLILMSTYKLKTIYKKVINGKFKKPNIKKNDNFIEIVNNTDSMKDDIITRKNNIDNDISEIKIEKIDDKNLKISTISNYSTISSSSIETNNNLTL